MHEVDTVFAPTESSQHSMATDAEPSEHQSENKLCLSHVCVLIKNALLVVLGCVVDLELWCYRILSSAEHLAAASGCTGIFAHVEPSRLFRQTSIFI